MPPDILGLDRIWRGTLPTGPTDTMDQRDGRNPTDTTPHRSSFGLGPAPIPLARGRQAWYLIRLAVSGLAVVVHAGLAIAWQWHSAWWIVLLAAAHLTIGVPLSHRRFDRPELVHAVDVTAIAGGLLIIGDPGAVAPWAAATTVFIVAFIGGRAAIVSLLGSGAAYAAVAAVTANVDAISPAAAYRPGAYQAFAAVLALAVTLALILASGAAVAGRERELASEQAAHEAAERETSLANRRLEMITEGTPIGLALQNRNGGFISVNDGFVTITGMSKEEISRAGVVPVMMPDELHEVERTVSTALAAGAPYHFSHRLWRRDATQRFVEVWGTPLAADDDDESADYVVTMLDRTLEIEQRHRIERLGAIVDATTDLVASFDAIGRLIGANPAFVEFYGLDQQWRGKALVDCARTNAAADTRLFFELAGAETARSVEAELTRHDGKRIPVSLVVLRQPGRDATLDTYAWICRDISHQRDHELSLRDAIDSRDRLVANVSHELRTPLTAVVGLAHELRDRYRHFSEHEVSEFVDIMAEQSSEVSHIVEDLLTMARADSGQLAVQPEPVGLIHSAALALDSLPRSLRDRVDLGKIDVEVVADPSRTRQIIRNLLTNAMRYGGERISISVGVAHGMGCLAVADDGPPIPPEEQARMFEAYQRLDPLQTIPGATGLGLTVSRELAHLMGGSLSFTRQDGENVFRLLLPLAL